LLRWTKLTRVRSRRKPALDPSPAAPQATQPRACWISGDYCFLHARFSKSKTF
jgi:hypothetical protein